MDTEVGFTSKREFNPNVLAKPIFRTSLAVLLASLGFAVASPAHAQDYTTGTVSETTSGTVVTPGPSPAPSLITDAPLADQPEDQSQAPAAAPTPEPPGHVLAGHRYLPSFYFPNPFAVPTAEFDLGLGVGTFSRERLRSDRDLKIGALAPKIETQIKLADRFMLIAGITGDVALGLNGESVAFYGASARYRPRLGLLWQFMKRESTVMSFGFEWEKPVTVQASPADAVSAELGRLLGVSDVPSATTTETTRWRPTLRFAHTLNEMFGVTGYAGLAAEAEAVNGLSTDRTTYSLGLSLDTNFRPLWKIPLGVTVNVRHADLVNGEAASSQIYSVGLFETFSDRYNFGLEAGTFQRGDQHATIGAFVTRYYY